ncbi:MAG: quinolinate synthase NadA [Clostridia bacterium]|nr:quinolinate synthase NadA [Clostridia bacterium]
MIRDLQDKILRLKKERDFCILAHSYESHEILEVADYTGDSFGLSKSAMNVPQKNLLLCGVRFMAETAKILSPEKRVYLSHSMAGCPMAEQFDKERVLALKEQYPDAPVVAYINTTAALKTVCDVCVTSSSAVKIVRAMREKRIIFIPDCNLGAFVQKAVPEKELILLPGGCPVHAAMSKSDVARAKAAHPDALFLVHPECKREVVDAADFAGSTTAIMDFVRDSAQSEFIIGTENSIVAHLQYEYPERRFYPLSVELSCSNMRVTTLPDVYNCMLGTAGEEILLDEATIAAARRPIDAMIAMGG